MVSRGQVVGAVLIAAVVLSIVTLWNVLGTVLFAITTAYVLTPLRTRFRAHGVPRHVASVATTACAVLAVAVALSPIAYLLIIRFGGVVTAIETLPDSIPLEFAGFTYTVLLSDLTTFAIARARQLGTALAASLPVLLIKFALFALLLFALLDNEQSIQQAVLGSVPPEYRDIVESLAESARETLSAIYILQAATAFGTFLIALPIFVAFGYDAAIALATIAGLLQFVPILGPTVLLVVLAGVELLAGDTVGAIVILVGGGVLIGWLPDLLIRPRLASYTTDIPGSLYFIGFVGGLLTVGSIGVIVGPLAVGLLVESASIAAREYNAGDQRQLSDVYDDTDQTSDQQSSATGEDDLGDEGSKERLDESSDHEDDR